MVVKNMTAVKDFFGLPLSTVEYWRRQGMPGGRNHWDLREIVAWLRQEGGEWNPKKVSASTDLRDAQAKLTWLKVEQAKGTLVPRKHVQETFRQYAYALRTAGDLLQRTYGEDAREILIDALDEGERLLSAALDDGSDAARSERRDGEPGAADGVPGEGGTPEAAESG